MVRFPPPGFDMPWRLKEYVDIVMDFETLQRLTFRYYCGSRDLITWKGSLGAISDLRDASNLFLI